MTTQTPRTLEEILIKCFHCNKPFLKRPQPYYEDGCRKYNYLTLRGSKAYDELVETIYGLEAIGAIADANHVIEILDEIVDSEDC